MYVTDFKDQVLQARRLNIVSVIEVDEPLRQCGRDLWVGQDHPSLKINPEKGLWHWWSKGIGGDAIAWMTEIHQCSFCDAIRELVGFGNGKIFPQMPKMPKSPAVPNPPFEQKIVDRYHADLMKNQAAIAQLPKFGLSLDLAREYRLGFKADHWGMGETFVIPVFDGNRILTIRHRMWNPPDKLGKYLPERKGDGIQLFGWDKLAPETVIVEGEKKAMVMNAAGIPTVGIMGADSFGKSFDARFAATCKTAYIMLDPANAAGQLGVINHAAKLGWIKRLTDLGVDCRACWLPAKPDDMILDQNDIETVFYSMEYSTRIIPEVKLTSGK